MPANLENTAMATGLEKVSFHSNPKEGQSKECSNYHTIALISHASKVMLTILQARLQQYMNCEHLDIQAGFWTGRGTRDQISNIQWSTENAREFQKNTYLCFIDYSKTFNCMDYNKLWKILKGKYQTIWPASWEICMQIKKQHLELDMEQQTGSKLGKEYIKAVYFHLLI